MLNFNKIRIGMRALEWKEIVIVIILIQRPFLTVLPFDVLWANWHPPFYPQELMRSKWVHGKSEPSTADFTLSLPAERSWLLTIISSPVYTKISALSFPAFPLDSKYIPEPNGMGFIFDPAYQVNLNIVKIADIECIRKTTLLTLVGTLSAGFEIAKTSPSKLVLEGPMATEP